MTNNQEIAETDTNKIISFFYIRHGLVVINTILLLITIFYKIAFPLQPLSQSIVLPLFIIGFYGYAILMADIFAEIFRSLHPLLSLIIEQT